MPTRPQDGLAPTLTQNDKLEMQANAIEIKEFL